MTYLDHIHYVPSGAGYYEVLHSWSDYTARRLEWLYGPGRADTPQAQADLAAWNALGQRVAA